MLWCNETILRMPEQGNTSHISMSTRWCLAFLESGLFLFILEILTEPADLLLVSSFFCAHGGYWQRVCEVFAMFFWATYFVIRFPDVY